MRYLPVRERAFRALQAGLEEITVAHGYNFDVRHVYRKRRIPDRADDPVEVHLLFGNTEMDQSYNAYQNKEYAEVFIWFILPDTGKGDEDLQYNLFYADLVTRLDCVADGSHDIIDTTHPEGRIVDIYFDKHLPKYSEVVSHGGVVVGRFDCKIGYVYKKTKPNLWDDQDALVPLVE